MTLRTSRRRVAQTALATAAVATLPRSRAAAQQATPVPGEAAITAAQVECRPGPPRQPDRGWHDPDRRPRHGRGGGL